MAMYSNFSFTESKLCHFYHVQDIGEWSNSVIRPAEIVEKYCKQTSSNGMNQDLILLESSKKNELFIVVTYTSY